MPWPRTADRAIARADAPVSTLVRFGDSPPPSIEIEAVQGRRGTAPGAYTGDDASRGLGQDRDPSTGARRSGSELPADGGTGVGNVGAVRPGVDGVIEVLAELGMVVSDSGDRLADGAGHSGSSAFGRGRGSPITTP